jgi:hypothetical protein
VLRPGSNYRGTTSTDDILLGLGLVLVLAVSCQLLARRLRVPAIVLLLPVGFIAGIATEDVQPDKLLGALYQPFVSVAVGIILFVAGLGLLLTGSDDFNALVAAELRDDLGLEHVYRVDPDPEQPDLLPPPREIGILGGAALTFVELSRRFDAGAHITNRSDATPADNGTAGALRRHPQRSSARRGGRARARVAAGRHCDRPLLTAPRHRTLQLGQARRSFIRMG